MNVADRIEILHFLGNVLKKYLDNSLEKNDVDFICLDKAVNEASTHNPWFTKDNIEFSLKYWSQQLTKQNIYQWLNKYDLSLFDNVQPKKVLIVAAGNIPLVSLHDIISVFLTGNNAIIKLSSKDKFLPTELIRIINRKIPETQSFFYVTEEKVGEFDAVIATGSKQSQAYFEYYFGKKPHIFRSHRNSVAIITGTETDNELELLGNDIFRYFGLGCRNISKIYVPNDYSFDRFIKALKKWEHIFYHHYYLTNYEYQKTIYLLNKEPFIDAGFFMLKENDEIYSPIGVIYYEYFSELCILAQKLKAWSSQIQCIVSKENNMIDAIPFGLSQTPQLWDYADKVDVINFLIQL